MGAWWNGERWFPAAWTQEGFYIDEENERPLDLVQKQVRGKGSKKTPEVG